MKINKLFHWLYGALMCLPLLGVLFTSLYVTFNPNAVDSYSGVNGYSIDYKYESNVVNDLDDLQLGHIYEFDFKTNYVKPSTTGYTELGRFFAIYLLERSGSTVVQSYTVSCEGDFISLTYSNYNDNIYFSFNNIGQQNIGSFSAFNNKIVVVFLKNSYMGYTAENYSYTDFNVIEGVEISNEGTLDNVFTYAINDINNNPLYNWAQDSFLVAPIAFVTGLFGLTQTSPVVTLLSYWLTISIVWLVFDLIMYIPLLVHRWLDKGVLS